MLTQHNTLLGSAAYFWQGYSSYSEAETPYLRQWSDETLARGMIERASALVEAYVATESNQPILKHELARDGSILHTTSYQDWNGTRVSIIGVDSRQKSIPNRLGQLLEELSASSLCFCLLPSSYIEYWQDFVSVLRTRDRFVIPLFPMDVNALAKGLWSLLNLVEYKLYRVILLEKDDVETQFSDSQVDEFLRAASNHEGTIFSDLQKHTKHLDDAPSTWVDHPELERLVGWLRDGRDCLLVGPSSSGKSVLAFEAGIRMQSTGYQAKFVDVGSLSPHDISRAFSNLRTQIKLKKEILLIYDDLQGSPTVARFLLQVTELLRRATLGDTTTVLAITWLSYAEQAERQIPNLLRIDIDPASAQRAMLAKHRSRFTPHEINLMSETSQGDVLIWKLMLESPRDSRPSKADLAKVLFTRRTKAYRGDSSALKRVVLVTALLGQYEFEIPFGFLEFQTGIPKTTLENMIRARVLRRSGDKVTLGHRSICLLLATWLGTDQEIWDYLRNNGKPDNPADIILAFIRTSNVSEIWAILRALRLQAGFKGTSQISYSAQTLVEAWKDLDSLIERIDQQQLVDPTWNKTLSSSLFAIQALCAVGKRKSAKPSIEFMRSLWSYSEGRLEIRKGDTARLDFDQIYLKMKEEDEFVGFVSRNRERAEDVDLDRFHDTWAAGLILCAEAAYGERSKQELESLAIAVEALQEVDGNFYPRRVPWCTARVLESLAKCGRNYNNSSAVKKACDWLLLPVKNGGPFQEGVWESGTGAWNNQIETTAMCVIALTQAGISPNDPRLGAALDYINSEKVEWTKQRHEIDGAFAVRAYLEVVGSWSEITREVQYLLKSAKQEAFWDSATKTAKESFDQSCRVAAIASYLIDAAWSNLRNDLPVLLDAFAVSPIVTAEGSQVIVATPRESLGSAKSSDSERRDSVSPIPQRDSIYTPLQSLIEQSRSQTVQRILLETEDHLGKLREQLRELKAFQEKLQHTQGSTGNLEELETRRELILRSINEIETTQREVVRKLQTARTQREIEENYKSWQDANKD